MEPQPSDVGVKNLSNPDRAVTTSEFATMFDNLITRMRRIFELPNVVAESVPEDSLARNEAVSEDIDEVPSTSKGLVPSINPETTKKIKRDCSQSEDAGDEYLRVAPGDKLCEHELTLIFSNTWISPRDLLNFRLVSKRWRDAATTAIHRRNATFVDVFASSVPGQPSVVYKNNGQLTDKYKLSHLTKIMKISLKFPATEFRIHVSLENFTPYNRFPDLLKFFKLHGDNIKTLRHNGMITAKCLENILLKYVPLLEHLDLSYASVMQPVKKYSGKRNLLKWQAIPLKSVTLGHFGQYYKKPKTYGKDMNYDPNRENNFEATELSMEDGSHDVEFPHLLLSFPSKLGSIENVTLKSLQVVIKERKGHLIRSFEYILSHVDKVPATQLKKFLSLNPKPLLSEIRLDMLYDEVPSSAKINSMSDLLETFKDTIETVKIDLKYCQDPWSPLLKIPPMKKLKTFTLMISTLCGFSGEDYLDSECRVCQGEEFKMFIDIRGTFFQFEDGISAQNYFPSLMDVCINSSFSKCNEVSPMSFFSFKSNTENADNSQANLESFPKVEILAITRVDIGSRPKSAVTSDSPMETSLIPEVFPNVRILQFECGEVRNLSNVLWTLCPNVEFMKISGITSHSRAGTKDEMSYFVDQLFTGISDRILKNLRSSAAGLVGEAIGLAELQSAIRKPSVTDLRHLRELKLMFKGNLASEFASSVTGVHAFSKMENTKFIISYDFSSSSVLGLNEDGGSDGDRNEIDENTDGSNTNEDNRDEEDIGKYKDLIFGAIKPYVHIVNETTDSNFCSWD